jgi:hypothetical protein
MSNYFVAECPECLATQAGFTSLDQLNAILRCKKCKRTAKLRDSFSRPDGAYCWYFGDSPKAANAWVKELKMKRKR